MSDKEIPEATEDLEQFDELEKNFHKVVSELVVDQSLASFRVEYEKLHKSLVQSHDDNLKLIAQCRQLNEDILANASKVSSVMSLSQKDQVTINGLKHEFEKAWSLVEISQEKEQKSKDVIDSLKAEVSKLSRLVEQGSTLAFSQENSLHETEVQISQLKSDIENQNAQLETMKQELERLHASQEQIDKDKAELTEEINKLNEESEQGKKEEQEVTNGVEEVHKNLINIKNLLRESQSKIEENVGLIKARKGNNDYLREKVASTKSNLKVENEDLKTLQSEMSIKKKLLEDELKTYQRIQNDMNNKKEGIKNKDGNKQNFQDELGEIKTENTILQDSLAETKKALNDINNEKKEKRQRISLLQQEMLLRMTELNELQSNIAGVRREIEKIRKEHHNLTAEKLEESHETVFVEGQNSILLNQAVDIKTDTHGLRKVVVQIQSDIEEYQTKQSAIRSNHIQLIDEVRNREIECDEKAKHLADLYETIKHQVSLTESIKNDRDLVHRLLQAANAENQKLADEIKFLGLGISELKGDIRENDQLCLSTHITQKNLNDSLIQLTKQRDELKKNLVKKELDNTELRNHIQKSRYLFSQTDLQNMKQVQVINDLKSIHYSLNESVTKKTVEISAIREEIYLLKGEMTVGSLAFKNITEDIQKKKEELNMMVAKKQQLTNEVRHSKALWKEGIQLTKALLLEQGRRKALEEELERPMNIHRWRFLEGTNPELLQLIKMSMELRDKLMVLIYKLQSEKEARNKMSAAAEKEEKHLKFSYCGNYDDDITFLTEALHQKTEQLTTIQRSVTAQQGKVEEQREVVLNMREMLKEEKEEYFDAKKKSDIIRASTVKGERVSRERALKSPENRFIGGGFSVQKTPTAAEKAHAIGARSALLSPNIIAPGRAKTAIRKKIPNGWNPQRQQLAPYLPTVTGPQ